MNKMKEVAKLLDVELNEPFEIECDLFNPFTLKENGIYDKHGNIRDVVLSLLLIGEYKIKKQWKPKEGDIYYIPRFYARNLYEQIEWLDDHIDKRVFNRNMVCETKEEAIALAKKMLEVAKSE